MFFNQKTVSPSLKFEPSLHAPRGAERVAADPVLAPIGVHSPSSDGHDVCGVVVVSRVAYYTASVLQEGLPVGIYGASDRASRVNLGLHLVFSGEVSEFGHVMLGALDETAIAVRVAVAAHALGTGHLGPVGELDSHVGGARDVRDAVLLDEFVGQDIATSLAATRLAVRAAVQEDLGRESDDRLGSLGGDDHPVRECARGGVGPARPARVGQELVGHFGHERLSVHRPPVVVVWKISRGYVLVWQPAGHMAWPRARGLHVPACPRSFRRPSDLESEHKK